MAVPRAASGLAGILPFPGQFLEGISTIRGRQYQRLSPRANQGDLPDIVRGVRASAQARLGERHGAHGSKTQQPTTRKSLQSSTSYSVTSLCRDSANQPRAQSRLTGLKEIAARRRFSESVINDHPHRRRSQHHSRYYGQYDDCPNRDRFQEAIYHRRRVPDGIGGCP